MINISEIVATWPQDEDGWSISPGVTWCAQGNRIRCGVAAFLGDDAHIGNYTSIGNCAGIGGGAHVGDYAHIGNYTGIGNCASIGNCARVGNGASVGDYARVGNGASVGNDAHVGDYARVGNGAHVGDYARSILADLGAEQVRGYGRAAYIAADGSVRISAGCRDFSIAEARAHWGSPTYPDRKRGDEYLALVDYVERLAEINGATT